MINRVDRSGTDRPVTALLIVPAWQTNFLPMRLTLYLSLFDEQMIVFSPHAYTDVWYTPILLGCPRCQIMARALFWELNTNSNIPLSAA